MTADMLALDRWDDRFLGGDVPIEDLACHAEGFAPKVVALSVTLVSHIPTTKNAIRLLRRALPSPKVLVGGLATEGDGVGSSGRRCSRPQRDRSGRGNPSLEMSPSETCGRS